MKFKLLIFNIVFMGCSSATVKSVDNTPVGLDIDPILEPFYHEFMAYGINNGYNMSANQYLHSIQFVGQITAPGTSTSTVGICIIASYNGGNQSRIVQILRSVQSDPIELKLVIWHEFGHALLNLQHTAPNSNTIMQPVIISDSQLIQDNWDSLVKYEFDSEDLK